MSAWYEEHKAYGGPEMNTDVWYANHKNYGFPAANSTGNGTGLFERADMVRAVLLWEVVRSVEEHALIKQLMAAEIKDPKAAAKTAAKKATASSAHAKSPANAKALPKSQVKQQTLAISTAERFNLHGWLQNEPHTDFLSLSNTLKDGKTEEGKMTQDVSDYLDSKTSLDLDTWLTRETMGPEHQKGKDDKKKSNFLGRWVDRHASPNLGGWLQSFSRASSGFRAGANARLAEKVMLQDEIALHQQATYNQLASSKLQSLQGMLFNKSGDPNSPNFDFETWWAELGQNQSGVAGSNWTKLLPEPEAGLITASDTVGNGSCCCGFACEQISNDCCGAWYAAGGGESYMHYGSFKQNPKSIAALSARAGSAQRQQRSTSGLQEKARMVSLAEVKTLVAKPLNHKAAIVAAAPKATKSKANMQPKPAPLAATSAKVSNAFGDRGFLGWMCTTDSCTSAPVRVGATCEVECLSTDGVNCMRSSSCLDQASKSAQDAQYVQCGAKMAEAFGTTGYDDPSHWCFCAKKKLAAQIDSCRGDQSSQGGNKGAVFANGLKFGAGISFASGDTFGDKEIFGAGDSFGSLEMFGNGNTFGKKARFGMDNTFGNKNHFEDGTVFESGAKLGNLNTVGKDVVFHHDAVLGVGNDISEHAKFGQSANLGKDTVLAPHTKLAADAHIGDGTVVGEGSMIAGGAVIGANVKIGKSVTLAGVASMGPGTEIGEGSSLGMAGSSLASGDASSDEDAAPQGDDSVATVGEEEAQEEEAQFYRPDPGSPFARKGNADMDMKLDGHNHWPVYLPWEKDEPAAEGEESEEDAEGAESEGAEESGGEEAK